MLKTRINTRNEVCDLTRINLHTKLKYKTMKYIFTLASLFLALHVCGQETKADSIKYRQAVYYQDLASNKILDGDREGALADFTKAIETYPKDHISYYNRGNLKVDMGDVQGAIADYGQAIEVKPDYTNAYYNRAMVKHDQGDAQGAIADYTKVIELRPNHPGSYSSRGEIYADLGEGDKALEDFLKAVEVAPKPLKQEDSALYSNIARVYYERKDFKKAISYYDLGIEISKADGNLYCSRGLAKQRQGNKKGSCEDWNIAKLLGTPQAAALVKEFCSKKKK